MRHDDHDAQWDDLPAPPVTECEHVCAGLLVNNDGEWFVGLVLVNADPDLGAIAVPLDVEDTRHLIEALTVGLNQIVAGATPTVGGRSNPRLN